MYKRQFLFHVRVDYPPREASREILRLVRDEALRESQSADAADPLAQADVFAARREVMRLHLAESVEEYIVELIEASRAPGAYGQDLVDWVRWGASPRGAIALERGARARAWLAGRDFVTPEDVQAIAPDAMRHRILLDYEAEAEGISSQRFIEELLNRVPAP